MTRTVKMLEHPLEQVAINGASTPTTSRVEEQKAPTRDPAALVRAADVGRDASHVAAAVPRPQR
jgi:hypothetical protein